VLHGCPLRTVQDCCEWHASGTAGEDNAGILVPPVPTLMEGEVHPWGVGHRGQAANAARQGLPSRPVADACGAAVLPDQGTEWPARA
jgi:hypothetical protein